MWNSVHEPPLKFVVAVSKYQTYYPQTLILLWFPNYPFCEFADVVNFNRSSHVVHVLAIVEEMQSLNWQLNITCKDYLESNFL